MEREIFILYKYFINKFLLSLLVLNKWVSDGGSVLCFLICWLYLYGIIIGLIMVSNIKNIIVYIDVIVILLVLSFFYVFC